MIKKDQCRLKTSGVGQMRMKYLSKVMYAYAWWYLGIMLRCGDVLPKISVFFGFIDLVVFPYCIILDIVVIEIFFTILMEIVLIELYLRCILFVVCIDVA